MRERLIKAWAKLCLRLVEFIEPQILKYIEEQIQVVRNTGTNNQQLLKANKAEYLKRLAEIEQRLKAGKVKGPPDVYINGQLLTPEVKEWVRVNPDELRTFAEGGFVSGNNDKDKV